MQFEQPQQSWPRKELNGTEPDSSPSQSNGNHGISEHIASIPLNKEGKRYTIKQAFNVWYDHQDDIFADVSVALKPSENYKLPQPQPIYHLDFSHSRSADDESSARDETDADNDPSLPADQEASFAAPKRHPGFPPNLSKSTSFGQETAPVAPEPVLLQPEDISWVYLDPAGNEQGPFTGDIMQEWLTDGYLSLDLRIRRQEEKRFQTLKDFCEAVQNFIQPFKVPLPRVVTESAQLPMPGAFQHQIADPPVSAESNGGFGGAGSFQNGGHSMAAPHQHQQSAFGSNLYSQLLPNGGLGAANIRTPSANPLFDFMGPSEYPLMNPQYSAGNQFGMDSMNPNLSFSQLHMPSLLQQQISSQQPSLSRSNSGWGMDNSMQNSLPSTPTATAAPVPLGIGQTQLGQSSLGQSGSMSPWINRVQTMSRVSSPFVPQSTLATDPADKVEDNLLSDMHSSMVSGILRDEDHNRGLASDLLADFSSNNVQLRSQPSADLTAKRESLAAPTKTEEANPKIDQAQVPLDAKPNPVIDETPDPSNEKPQSEEPQSSVKEEEKASQPAAAPWAKPKAKHDAPPLTLKQIQELEAERLQREKQLKAEMRQEIALASALAASKLEEKTPEKVTFNWAKSSQPLAAKKTLAEIQREEEAEAAKSRAAKSSVSSSSKVSLASALASTPVKEDGGAWTTVTSKKPAAKKLAPTTSQSGISYSALSGAINPQVLRNASSGVVPTTSLNTQAIKEDFLVWARSAMTNLYPSVSKNDLLEVFTTLPSHGESAQLISETIYSSSATMDGRRFAQEFLKRRQQVEKQVGPSAPESWSSAIISSADKVPAVDDDGWSTSVKSKKKGRKN